MNFSKNKIDTFRTEIAFRQVSLHRMKKKVESCQNETYFDRKQWLCICCQFSGNLQCLASLHLLKLAENSTTTVLRKWRTHILRNRIERPTNSSNMSRLRLRCALFFRHSMSLCISSVRLFLLLPFHGILFHCFTIMLFFYVYSTQTRCFNGTCTCERSLNRSYFYDVNWICESFF